MLQLHTSTYVTRASVFLFDTSAMLIITRDLPYRSAQRQIPYAHTAMHISFWHLHLICKNIGIYIYIYIYVYIEIYTHTVTYIHIYIYTYIYIYVYIYMALEWQLPIVQMPTQYTYSDILSHRVWQNLAHKGLVC